MSVGREREILIGVLSDNPDSTDYHVRIAAGLRRWAAENGASLIFFSAGGCGSDGNSSPIPGRALDAIDTLMDGLVLLTGTLLNSYSSDALLEALSLHRRIPTICVSAPLGSLPAVLVDAVSGIDELVGHLAEAHGFARIAHLSGPEDNPEAQSRAAAYGDSMRVRGLEPLVVSSGSFTAESGYRAALIALSSDLRPQALLCANDGLALGAWRASRELGLRPGIDVAITGYDDLSFSIVSHNPFTTARQPLEELGFKAAENLGRRIRGLEQGQSLDIFESGLVVRGSCGCARSVLAADAGEEYVDSGMGIDMVARDFEFLEVTLAVRRACARLGDELAASGFCRADEASVRALAEALGAEDFFVARYAGRGDPSSKARLVVALRGGAWIDLPPEGLPYPARDILPRECFPPARFDLVTASLRSGTEAVGLVAASRSGDSLQRVEGFPGILETPRLALERAYEVSRVIFRVSSLRIALQDENQARQDLESRLRVALSTIESLSVNDELTGLYNKRGFLSLLDQERKSARRRRVVACITAFQSAGVSELYARGDREGGDAAARLLGDSLSSGRAEGDVVARIGQDSFALLVEGQASLDPEALRAILGLPLALRVATLTLSPSDGRSAAELLADLEAGLRKA
jgi:LacI family transcriptional regulator